MKKVIVGLVKPGLDSTIRITLMIDALNQLVIIFYVNSNSDYSAVEAAIDSQALQNISSSQSCYFKLSSSNNGSNEYNITFAVPSYRLIKK